MNYEDICKLVINASKEAGDFIRTEAQKFSLDKIEVKGLHNFVSYVDKSAEQLLVDALHKILPEAGFITEEGTKGNDGEQLKWVIDPLDGTTNFIHGLPAYSVSLALMDGDETVVGVVYEINQNECFYSWKGGAAYLNGKQIQVSKAQTVQDSLIATGFPYYDFDKMKAYLASLEYIMKHSHGARRIGSAAVDLAYVACGRFEAFYEYSLQPWDVAAGAFILQQAGGKVCDFKGGSDYIFGQELIATNGSIHEEFLGIVQKYL
ncbi:MAG: inositol monophosphatase family protein [Bacteroidota bacterium]|nr:inositol monophosphatase family protein [Bacteroidota bacterium]